MSEHTHGQATSEHTHGATNEQGEEMCCDGKRTAAEHRKESDDGKCCVDD